MGARRGRKCVNVCVSMDEGALRALDGWADAEGFSRGKAIARLLMLAGVVEPDQACLDAIHQDMETPKGE